MAKSNDEIRREYAARSIPGQIGQAALDIANIGGNALAFGLPNRIAETVMGAPSGAADEVTRQARVRAGLAGDVANVAGMVRGGGLALGGAKNVVSAVRAAPVAATLARTAGLPTAARYLTGTAGAGLVPAAAKAGAKATAGTLAKGAGVLGLLGLSVAGRQEAGDASAVRAPAAKSAAAATPKPAKREITIADATAQDRAMAFLNNVLSKPLTLGEYERAAGTLPVVASVGTKQPRIADVAGQRALEQSQILFQNEIDQATKLAETDPIGARALVAQSLQDQYARESALAGVNNQSEALAQMLRNAGGDQ